MLVGTEPPTWPRHKWLGAAKSVDYIGLAVSIHPPMFKDAYLIWARSQPGGRAFLTRLRGWGMRSGNPISSVAPNASHIRDGFALKATKKRPG
eukprot:134125-Pyramimonas_sp.AAC.1